jgi:hypothetical protein
MNTRPDTQLVDRQALVKKGIYGPSTGFLGRHAIAEDVDPTLLRSSIVPFAEMVAVSPLDEQSGLRVRIDTFMAAALLVVKQYLGKQWQEWPVLYEMMSELICEKQEQGDTAIEKQVPYLLWDLTSSDFIELTKVVPYKPDTPPWVTNLRDQLSAHQLNHLIDAVIVLDLCRRVSQNLPQVESHAVDLGIIADLGIAYARLATRHAEPDANRGLTVKEKLNAGRATQVANRAVLHQRFQTRIDEIRGVPRHDVSRRLKPASDRRVKTSHFEKGQFRPRSLLAALPRKEAFDAESAQDGEFAVHINVTRARAITT